MLVSCFIVFLTTVGCGREKTQRVKPPAPKDEVRSALEYVVQTGQVDSGLITVREKLESMKATDAAKAESLLKDLDQLEKLGQQPEQAKTKAREMLQKLGGG